MPYIMSKKTKNALALAIAITSITLILHFSGAIGSFELKAYDIFSRLLNPESSEGDIIIIEIDQASIDALSELGIGWPWPRQIYAPLVEHMALADAVIIDMIYSEPSSYGVDDDKMFADSIRKASNVFLPVFLTNEDRDLDEAGLRFLKDHSVKDKISAYASFKSAVTPIDELMSVAIGTGNVMIKPDPDGVYRRVPLFFSVNGLTIANFVLDHLLRNETVVIKNGVLLAGDKEVPMSSDQLLLRFYRGEEAFPKISAWEVLESYQAIQEGRAPNIDSEFFKGKKVLIGPTAAGLYDLKPTSVSALSTGVMVHATALDNLSRADFMTSVPEWIVVLIIPLLCFIICHFIIRHMSIIANSLFLLAVIVVTVGASVLLFSNGYYKNITTPFVSVILSAITASVFSYATEGKERRFIKNTFSQYMDNKVVEHILEHPELIHPGGQKKEISLFFADIAGFTTMAERLPPQETAKILHTALNAFTEVIIGHGGVIDKYMGDAIMAFWGSPLATADDNRNSCLAAIQCSKALDEINEEFRNEGLSEINVRIGLHSGEALVGNLGSDRLFDYTAIGDNVNLASRLEGVNKVFKTRIIASEDTLKGIDDQFLTRGLGLIEVKGKALPVRIFELISEKGEADTDVEKMVTLYEKGVSKFMEKQWQEAISIFDEVEMISPGDGPSSYYRAWCTELSALSELTDDWNIIKMTVK
ncbi:MAG: adenylate/guanylate cyclase domain-containing protein [Nitrospirota bacterium]|nr:MAG: adenylate/guanylate cyclase domain-containing protein [Nitrospirota bacterium]